MADKDQIANSAFEDVQAPILDDIAPEQLIKIYPYEMYNASKSRAFVQQNTISLVSISQQIYIQDINNHDLDQDDNGDLFFKLLPSTLIEGKLDIASTTSISGQELKYEKSFDGVTDQFYYYNNENPIAFVVGEAFNKEKYEKDEQTVFIAQTINPANQFISEAFKEFDDINLGTLSQISFMNIKTIEAKYKNSRILFTTNRDLNKNITSFDGDTGLSLGIKNNMLIPTGGIQAKGQLTEFDSAGNEIGTEFGDINLQSKEKWAPFKFTPTGVKNNKLTMFADWFDYDTVLPFVFAEKFKQGAPLSDVITNTNDLTMVEDMLAVSAAFASRWKKAPLLKTGGDAGKIDPLYRIGSKGIKVTTIAGGTAIDELNTIYEDYIRDNPDFLVDVIRYQPVKEIINALSRYLYSNQAIGKGQNSYNMAYLPWYLEPFVNTPIKYDKKITIPNPDKGGTGDVDTYVLNDNIKFQLKSLYFTDNFSSKIPKLGDNKLILPPKVNVSNQILIQTDRKLTLPQLPEVIEEMDKLPLPGDIDTTSSKDLSYIFLLPIQDQDIFEKFMLNSLQDITSIPIGTDIRVQLPNSFDGVIYNQTQATADVLAKQPGTIVTPPIISNKTRQILIEGTGRVSGRFSSETTILIFNGWSINVNKLPIGSWSTGDEKDFIEKILIGGGYYNAEQKKTVQDFLDAGGDPTLILKIPPTTGGASAFVIADPGNLLGGYQDNYFRFQEKFWTIGYSTFSEAVVKTTTQTNKKYSFQGRETLFNKQNYESFLTQFNIIPKGFTRYSFTTEPNFKIDKIDELIITSVWGNEIELFIGTAPSDYFPIPIFNKDDETLSVTRILFT